MTLCQSELCIIVKNFPIYLTSSIKNSFRAHFLLKYFFITSSFETLNFLKSCTIFDKLTFIACIHNTNSGFIVLELVVGSDVITIAIEDTVKNDNEKKRHVLIDFFFLDFRC